MRGSKVKSSDAISGVIKILGHFLNGKKRNYVFMFPSQKKMTELHSVEVTIRDIQNDMSTCAIVNVVYDKGFVIVVGHSSKFGECKRREPYMIPKKKTERMELDVSIPLEIVSKIYSNVYKQFPLV
jgi:hypothetical protein